MFYIAALLHLTVILPHIVANMSVISFEERVPKQ